MAVLLFGAEWGERGSQGTSCHAGHAAGVLVNGNPMEGMVCDTLQPGWSPRAELRMET